VGKDDAVIVDGEAATILGIHLEVDHDLVEDGSLTGSDGESTGDLFDGVSEEGEREREEEEEMSQ